MAMTPKRSPRARATATAERNTPRTGLDVSARAASIPGSDAQATTYASAWSCSIRRQRGSTAACQSRQE